MPRSMLVDRDKLRRLIAIDDVDSVVELLKGRKMYGMSDDFLTYPIKRHNNEMVQVLVNFANINIMVNSNIALDVARASNNVQAIEYMDRVRTKPITILKINLPFTNDVLTVKLSKCMLLSKLKELVMSRVHREFVAFVGDKVLDLNKHEYVVDALYEHNESGRVWDDVFNVVVKLEVEKGVFYPSHRIEFETMYNSSLLNPYSGDEYKFLLDDRRVCKDGAVHTIVASSVPVNCEVLEHLSPTKDEVIGCFDVSQKRNLGNVKCVLDKLDMFLPDKDDVRSVLGTVASKTIVGSNSGLLQLIVTSPFWDISKVAYNLFMLCVEQLSVMCLKVLLDKVNVGDMRSQKSEAYDRATTLDDKTMLELLGDSLTSGDESPDGSLMTDDSRGDMEPIDSEPIVLDGSSDTFIDNAVGDAPDDDLINAVSVDDTPYTPTVADDRTPPAPPTTPIDGISVKSFNHLIKEVNPCATTNDKLMQLEFSSNGSVASS